MIGIALAMASRIRRGPRTRPLVALANGRTPRTGRATAVLASIGKPRRRSALTVRTVPVPKNRASNRGGGARAARKESQEGDAAKAVGKAAIPGVPRGWGRA